MPEPLRERPNSMNPAQPSTIDVLVNCVPMGRDQSAAERW
jgi:hypothetical protein